MDAKQVGENIARQRKQMGYSQSALSEKLGVTNKAVSRWETGEGYPDITMLPALSEVLKISADQCWGLKRRRIPPLRGPWNVFGKNLEDYCNGTLDFVPP